LPSSIERTYYRALRRASTALNSAEPLNQVMDTIVRGVSLAMQAGASLVLLDSSKKNLVHCASRALPKPYLQKGVLDAQRSLAEVIVDEPVIIKDVSKDSRVQYPEVAAKAGIVSILGVPLRLAGKAAGSIRIYARKRTDFTVQDIAFVTSMANLAAVAIERDNLGQQARAVPLPGTPLKQALSVSFAHRSEEEFARILDFYNIEWVYEPRAFVLSSEGERVTEMFTPDFYLPGLDLYIELTTLRQKLVTYKNRKLRRLLELYPEIKITLLYKKDFDRLLGRYGYGPLAQPRGRGVKHVLFSAAEVQKRVHEIAEQISRDYAESQPIMVGVLRGVFCFLADLVRQMTIPLEVDFMAVSHYGKGASVKITRDVDLDVSGRHVIMVEDIIDTGMTLNYMLAHIRVKNPASITVCTLLDKRVRRLVDLPLKYVGFEVPDEFVVGYGLDYREEYRNLPFIGSLNAIENARKKSP
jgi:bifunctional protein TilS/HprT